MSSEIDLLDSLESISSEPVSWWNLELTDTNEIKVADIWKACFQWLYAFYSCQLKLDLQNRVQKILEPMDAGHPFNARQQIAIEKIARLSNSQNSWLYGAVPNIPNPPMTKITPSGTIASSVQPYQEGGRYYNHPGERIWRQFVSRLYMLFPGSLSTPSNENLKTWNRVDWEAVARSIEPKITWLGHAGLLIQAANINLLFDPSFGFVSPCFLRHTEPPIPFEKLPLIDVVGISHNHGDHFDRSRLEKLAPEQPVAFVPEGLGPWFNQHGYQNVEGKTWWQQSVIERDGRCITLTAIPADHGSQTSLTDLNHTLWMGIMIEVDGVRIYFAGDTAYNKTMLEEIKKHFGAIDVACLPIAPEAQHEIHLDQNDALDALEILGAKTMIPIHHGAYRTGAEKIEDPLQLFTTAANQRGLSDRVSILKLGETIALREAVATQQEAI